MHRSRRQLLQHGMSTVVLSCACSGIGNRIFAQETTPINEDDFPFFTCEFKQIGVDVGTQPLAALDPPDAGADLALSKESVGTDPYATVQRSRRWTVSDVDKIAPGNVPIVSIKFHDGTEAQREEVKQFSDGWRNFGIKIDWEFLDPGDPRKPNILIAFDAEEKNSSLAGNEARDFARRGIVTMHLHEVNPAIKPKPEIRRMIVLHEFGHGIMCFGHEHRHPDAGYKFKTPEEIQSILWNDFGLMVSVTSIKTNITNPPYPTSRACGSYDVSSIMHYAVPKSFLAGSGNVVTKQPRTPSAFDVRCAKDLYE